MHHFSEPCTCSASNYTNPSSGCDDPDCKRNAQRGLIRRTVGGRLWRWWKDVLFDRVHRGVTLRIASLGNNIMLQHRISASWNQSYIVSVFSVWGLIRLLQFIFYSVIIIKARFRWINISVYIFELDRKVQLNYICWTNYVESMLYCYFSRVLLKTGWLLMS